MKCESCDRPILLNRQERKQTLTILLLVTAVMLAGAAVEWFATVDLLLLLKWTFGLAFILIGIPVWLWVKGEQMRLERNQ